MALSISSFSYTADAFYRLTPYQFFTSLHLYNEQKYNEYLFYKQQTRLINFFQVTSTTSSKIKYPHQLYLISADENTNTITDMGRQKLIAGVDEKELENIMQILKK
jgi:hypothetical protein